MCCSKDRNQNTQPELISNKIISLEEISVLRLPLSYKINFTIHKQPASAGKKNVHTMTIRDKKEHKLNVCQVQRLQKKNSQKIVLKFQKNYYYKKPL